MQMQKMTTNTKTVLVADASGAVLNWLVAKCKGAVDLRIHTCGEQPVWVYTNPEDDDFPESMEYLANAEYVTDWVLAGPIIDQNCINLYSCGDGSWKANWYFDSARIDGSTPLLAVMRCYVTSVLGNSVEVPFDLL